MAIATVYRDRSAFNAASQNLRTIDFENVHPDFGNGLEQQIDGLVFSSINGFSITTLVNPQPVAFGSYGGRNHKTDCLPPTRNYCRWLRPI
jgi:hypothetical protein